MIKEHGTQFNMISDRNIHIGFEEIIPDVISMFEQKPAPCPIHWEHTDLFSGSLYERGNLLCGELQEILKGKHGLLHRRGKRPGI
jgi:hypothetical protein